ncbi:MAG TPA: hypothetical protein DCG34_11060 [Clostridiales bacterium]|jgi:hypothetical protein|nr:hypothetical protein [Clostridiales bacterium]
MQAKNQHMIIASSLAVLTLIISLSLPFFYSDFALDMPIWLPQLMTGKIQKWAIEKGQIATGTQYLLGIIRELFESREFFLGWTIVIFSLGLPVIKVILVLFIALAKQQINESARKHILGFLHAIGRWAMTDVFIVALCIVIFKAEGFHFRITAGAGLYFYAASGCCSAIAVHMVNSAMQRETVGD